MVQNGTKRRLRNEVYDESQSKRTRLLSEEDATEGLARNSKNELQLDLHESHNVKDSNEAFNINSEYARRFEHNKQREELQRRELILRTYGQNAKSHSAGKVWRHRAFSFRQ